ncbi:uncharacterized protein LOC121977526 isoform X2 [Zingiber officinale]|uniref:uncharacterized protein LOC121977526 isoform X2 n=1 Tax=Zingiber officinale TaxID=94328 RepID=UPI001C4C8815|nr:uncharacterized protein LOC121977526 isoform X2 [Zingiber officinale]
MRGKPPDFHRISGASQGVADRSYALAPTADYTRALALSPNFCSPPISGEGEAGRSCSLVFLVWPIFFHRQQWLGSEVFSRDNREFLDLGLIVIHPGFGTLMRDEYLDVGFGPIGPFLLEVDVVRREFQLLVPCRPRGRLLVLEFSLIDYV